MPFVPALLGVALALGPRVAIAGDDEGSIDRPDLTLRLGSATPTTAAEAPAPAPDEPKALDLAQLVALALDDSFQVRVSQAQVLQARALRRLAFAQALPRAEGNLIFGGPTPETKTEVVNDIDTVTPSSFGGDLDFGELGVTFRGDFTAGVPVYTFGKISRGNEASEHLVEAARLDVRARRADVVVDLTRAYWGWQLLEALVESLDEGEQRLESVLEQIEELLDADSPQVTENDRLRLKFALSTLSVRRVQAEGGVIQLEQAIRLLIGRAQRAPLRLERASLEKAAPQRIPAVEDLVTLARADRPDLSALREVVAAQRAFKELRVAQLFPDLLFGGFLNFAFTTNATDQTNPFIFDPFNIVDAGLGLGLRFELDVFTKLARIEQAEADLELRSRQEILATEASELDVRRLHAELRAEIEQSKRLERANLSARGWLTAATLAYDIGAGRADELIDAFLAWATSEAELQNARYESLVLKAELGRATGELVAAGAGRDVE